MARILLLGQAREAAGTRHDTIEATTLDEVLQVARGRYGTRFAEILEISRVWVNGEEAEPDRIIAPQDEVAILPPVSGG